MVHGLTLEPEAFFSEAIVVDVSTRNTKAYREAKKATNADVYLQHEIDLGTEIACAVHGDKYAAELIEDAVFETSFFWHEQGVNCKARTDIWQPRNNIVADLKTTTDASPKAFARDVLKYGMHISAAWYRRGLESAGHKLDKWFWIAVEKMPPYAVQVYRADDFWLDLADARIDAALPYLRECRRTDTWPSYADGVFNLAVPPWAYD
jgi:exodeoxyribonuclease VIII